MAGDNLRTDALYHLATPAEWADYQLDSWIDPSSLDREGFVHCSWGRQVGGTVEKHFADCEALLALQIEPALLGDVVLVEEDSYGSGQTFPHAYGPIPVAAVVAVIDLVDAG